MSDKTCLENMPQKNVTITERYCRIKEGGPRFSAFLPEFGKTCSSSFFSLGVRQMIA